MIYAKITPRNKRVMHLQKYSTVAVTLFLIALSLLTGCVNSKTEEFTADKEPAIPEKDDVIEETLLDYDIAIQVGQDYFTSAALENGESIQDNIIKNLNAMMTDLGADNLTYMYKFTGEDVILMMTQEYYEILNAKVRESVNASLVEIMNNPNYEYVDDIVANENFTDVVVSVDKEVYVRFFLDAEENGESFRDYVPGNVALCCSLYQMFTPEGIKGTSVKVLDKETAALLGGPFTFPTEIDSSNATSEVTVSESN